MSSGCYKFFLMKNYKEVENQQRGELITHKQILSSKEAMRYLDVSKSFLYKLTSKKEIKFSKPNGGKIYFKKADLDDWMLQNTSITISELREGVSNYLKGKRNEK